MVSLKIIRKMLPSAEKKVNVLSSAVPFKTIQA
jgi:hypothetical protein